MWILRLWQGDSRPRLYPLNEGSFPKTKPCHEEHTPYSISRTKEEHLWLLRLWDLKAKTWAQKRRRWAPNDKPRRENYNLGIFISDLDLTRNNIKRVVTFLPFFFRWADLLLPFSLASSLILGRRFSQTLSPTCNQTQTSMRGKTALVFRCALLHTLMRTLLSNSTAFPSFHTLHRPGETPGLRRK